MNRNPFRRTLIIAAFFSTLAGSKAGSSVGVAPSGSLDDAAQREIVRREEGFVIAEQELKAGDLAGNSGDAEGAYAHYKKAIDLVPQGWAAGGLRSRAVSRFSAGSVRYAEYLVSRGEYAEARRIAGEVLEPRYNPDYRAAIVFLGHLEEADYFNKTVTPQFSAQRDEVQNLMTEAVGFYDSGRYDLAQKRYQQILAIDNNNAAAFRGLEQVELGKQRYYETAYDETRSRMLWQVEKAWERPHRKFEEPRLSEDVSAVEARRGTEAMLSRLNRIFLNEVNFNDLPIREAVAYLKNPANWSTDQGVATEAINIFVDLPKQTGAVATTGGEQSSQPVPVSDKITLQLNNVPLYEALRYAALQVAAKVRVEPFAVTIEPESKQSSVLQVREFKVPPGFIPAMSSNPEESAAFAGNAEQGVSAKGQLSARQDAKSFLESKNINFPPGASALYQPASSRLVVKNAPDELEMIGALVEAAKVADPTQVEIEAKFVEISQDNIKELGFDWTLGPFSIGGSGVYGGGGNSVVPAGAFPINYPSTSVPVGENLATGGLRSGSAALSGNSIDALLRRSLGLTSSGGAAPAIFSVAGIFTNPQFQMVIRALNQKKGVDLMAAPKVTTKSGQKATITLSREFPYPQGYEPPQIPQDSGGGNAIISGSAQSDPIVTPSFPTDFTTRNLGVTLEVEPQIGPDGYTVDLTLTPEVVEFDGFVNYGSPIYAPSRSLLGQTLTSITNTAGVVATSLLDVFTPTTQRLLTENTINQPIFSKRRVTTSVSIWDGQTVVLGGLIREDVQKVADKVPVLGDIPVAGALFRSEVEQKIKRNLVIFTTARLIDGYGQRLRPESDADQEEVVEPLGLPPETKPPRGNPKSGITSK